MMTTEEMISRVKEHLLAQNERSAVGTRCLYRGPRGLKCAVGILISDEDYCAAMERRSPRAESVCKAIENTLERPPSQTELDTLERLQYIHDTKPVDRWASALEQY